MAKLSEQEIIRREKLEELKEGIMKQRLTYWLNIPIHYPTTPLQICSMNSWKL